MDLNILIFIQSLRTTFLDIFFTAYTHLGDHGILWILILVVLALHKPTRKIAWFGAAAMLIELAVVNGVLKPLIMRPRPFTVHDVELLIQVPADSSFPSGHTANAFAAATYLFLWKLPCRKTYLALAALMGFSRMYLFVHYPSDVLAGMLIGIAVGVFTYHLSRKYIKIQS